MGLVVVVSVLRPGRRMGTATNWTVRLTVEEWSWFLWPYHDKSETALINFRENQGGREWRFSVREEEGDSGVGI